MEDGPFGQRDYRSDQVVQVTLRSIVRRKVELPCEQVSDGLFPSHEYSDPPIGVLRHERDTSQLARTRLHTNGRTGMARWHP